MRSLTGPIAGRVAGLTLAATLLAGCSGGDDVADAPTATESDAATQAPTSAPETASDDATEAGTEDETAATVSVVDFAFEPAEMTVSPGETITWTNEGGGVNHTVTFNDGPDSGTLAMGQAFTVDFDEPGAYTYFCRFHGQMQGTVTVEG